MNGKLLSMRTFAQAEALPNISEPKIIGCSGRKSIFDVLVCLSLLLSERGVLFVGILYVFIIY